MTLFAEITDASILAIVGVVYAIIKLVEKVYDNYQLKKAAAVVATKVDEVRVQVGVDAAQVKKDLTLSTVENKKAIDNQNEKLDTISQKVDEVAKVQNNG